ncbi:hypothetical protein VTK56DRAFT_8056 [Thermocarpiscus australiensis]
MDSPSPAAVSTQEKTSRIVSEYLKGKDEQWRAIYERKRPLTLLELPIDILQLIVKEITHTNDLTTLALTNSALYSLAIPQIYSRFDIVWPDGHISTTESKSVDALTYGLSTLCLGSAFARTARKALHRNTCRLAKLTDNQYAKYTRKFSLGNGPSDWVAEYLITKESGKMLGTLVSIAVAKMKNLETFIWDMPTGVLSDVFMALASLADQPDSQCKLNRVWIRWHDNSESFAPSAPPNPSGVAAATALVPQGSQLTSVGIMLPTAASHPPPRTPVSYSEYRCEYPTFSVLPPLKSLTVLDIDEVGYLDEMAVLIERSKDTLQELRVGISAKAAHKDFAQTWDGPGLKQIDHGAQWPGESTIGERRLGGVLGVLVGRIYDIRRREPSRPKDKSATDASAAGASSTPATPLSTTPQAEGHATLPANGATSDGTEAQQAAEAETNLAGDVPANPQGLPKGLKPSNSSTRGRMRLEGKLKLHTLELERVALSLQVCRYAIDWSVLTTLTLLDCAQHDNLWKMLRKQFQPTPMGTGFGISSRSKPPPANAPLQYHLALKAIHTDTTTLSLIAFIKETLAPNSLEVLFLQDRRRASPPLLLDAIFKGALKRHHASLRKLLLDSSAKPSAQGAAAPGDNVRWRNWALTTDILLYITSGRLSNLRELAASLDYKDWHTFLQRLPNMPQLRSLNIPHVADYPTGSFEPRELAHQITDIITLRPEIRLCYIGIGSKCFEVLEHRELGVGLNAKAARSSSPAMPSPTNGANGMLNGTLSNNNTNAGPTADQEGLDDTTSDEEDGAEDEEQADGEGGESDQNEEEDADDEDDEEEDDDDDDGNTPTTATSDPDETQSDNEAPSPAGAGGVGGGGSAGGEVEEGDEDDDGFVEPDRGGIRLKLREILFYDDKVAIFRARHGKL